MAKNEFKPFATSPNANVTAQTDWEELPALLSGFQAGKASSAQVNKAIRQATFIAAALAQYTANNSGMDVLDDGDLNSFISKMGNAFGRDYQPLDATLTALAGLATGANKIPYFTGTDTAAQTDLTSVGRDIIGKNTVAEILAYLRLNDLGTAARYNVGSQLNQIPDMSYFRASMTESGYLKIPVIGSGGGAQTLILQWGSTLTAPNSIGPYNLNIAFPNKILFAMGNRWANGSNASMNVKPYGTQQIQIQNWAPSGDSEVCAWIAIGY